MVSNSGLRLAVGRGMEGHNKERRQREKLCGGKEFISIQVTCHARYTGKKDTALKVLFLITCLFLETWRGLRGDDELQTLE